MKFAYSFEIDPSPNIDGTPQQTVAMMRLKVTPSSLRGKDTKDCLWVLCHLPNHQQHNQWRTSSMYRLSMHCRKFKHHRWVHMKWSWTLIALIRDFLFQLHAFMPILFTTFKTKILSSTHIKTFHQCAQFVMPKWACLGIQATKKNKIKDKRQ